MPHVWRVLPNRDHEMRSREKMATITELAGESACPTLLLKTLETCGAGAFACQPILSRTLRERCAYERIKVAYPMHRVALLVLCAAALFAQSDLGELRLKVTDPAGLAVPSSVELVSQSNQVRQELQTDSNGVLVMKRLAFGIYRIRVEHAGFTALSSLIEIRSALPKEYGVMLGVAPVETVVVVDDGETLLDPHRSSTANHIGPETLQDRPDRKSTR